MDTRPKEQQSLSKEAFLAFNNIGGQIKTRSLEILRKKMSERGLEIADRSLVQEAYWDACQEILKRR